MSHVGLLCTLAASDTSFHTRIHWPRRTRDVPFWLVVMGGLRSIANMPKYRITSGGGGLRDPYQQLKQYARYKNASTLWQD